MSEEQAQYRAPGDRGITLTLREAALLCDVLSVSLLEPGHYRWLATEVGDALAYGNVASKWRVDGARLVGMLHALREDQAAELYGAVRRFWAAECPRDLWEGLLAIFQDWVV